jgi:hypothetical protein
MADKAMYTLLKVQMRAPIEATHEGVASVYVKVDTWEVSAPAFEFAGCLRCSVASDRAAEADAHSVAAHPQYGR